MQDIDWVQTEKHVFEIASNHPFLVGLHSCFQTPSRSVFASGETVPRAHVNVSDVHVLVSCRVGQCSHTVPKWFL